MANNVVQFVLKGVDEFSPVAKQAERSLSGVASFAAKAGGAIAAALAGWVFKKAVDEALNAESAFQRMSVAVGNAGGNMSALRGPLDEVIDGLVRTTTASDDDLREAFTRLVTITGDVNGGMKNLGLVADVAAYKQIGVAEAAELVGKAQQGNTRVLKEFGIVGLEGAAAMDALRAKTEGFGTAAAQTMGGGLKQLQNQFGELLESLGNAILANDQFGQGIGGLTGLLADTARWIDENAGVIGQMTGAVVDLAMAIGSVLGPVLKVLAPVAEVAFKALTAGIYAALDALGRLAVGAGAIGQAFGVDAAGRLERFGRELIAVSDRGFERLARTADQAEEKVATFGATMRTTTPAVKEHGDALKKTADAGQAVVASADDIRKAQDRQKFAMMELARGAMASMNTALAEMDKRLEKLHPSYITFQRALNNIKAEVEASNAAFVQAYQADKIDKARREAQALGASIADGARAALDLASAFGVADDALTAALNSAINLGAQLAKIVTGGLNVGSVVGAISASAALISKLFGKSPALEQHERALAQNRRALEGLTGVMQSQLPGGKIAGIQSFLTALGLSPTADLSGDKTRYTTSSLLRGLSNYGLTLGDLDRLAKEFGLNLDISNGSVARGALQQLLAALSSVDIRPFQGGVGGLLDQLDALVQSGAITGPAAQLDWLTTRVGSGNSRALAEAISGVDYSTAAGRATATERLRALLARANTLAPGDLGNLNSQQFLDLIQRYIGLLTADWTGGVGSMPAGDGVGAPGAGGTPGTPAEAPAWALSLTTGPGWLSKIAAGLGADAPYLADVLAAVRPLAGLQATANTRLAEISQNTARAMLVADVAAAVDRELYRRGVVAATAGGRVA